MRRTRTAATLPDVMMLRSRQKTIILFGVAAAALFVHQAAAQSPYEGEGRKPAGPASDDGFRPVWQQQAPAKANQAPAKPKPAVERAQPKVKDAKEAAAPASDPSARSETVDLWTVTCRD